MENRDENNQIMKKWLSTGLFWQFAIKNSLITQCGAK
jgi:hypothetical protein